MSPNLETALTGERDSKSMVTDTICDPDTCFILSNVNTYNASKACICCKYLLPLLIDIVNQDEEQSVWVYAVCLYLHSSSMQETI